MKRAISIFAILSTILIVTVTADTTRPHFESSSGTRLYVGSEIVTSEPDVLEYEGTRIQLDARTNFTIKHIDDDRLAIFATRGHWSVEPDREVQICTRKVCATTESAIEFFYYTPGEVVEIKTSGTTMVEYGDIGYILTEDNRIVIDELTGSIR